VTLRARFDHLSAPVVGLLAAITLFALLSVDVMTLEAIQASRISIGRTRRAQTLLGSVRASLLDAETGERGFLLTGRGDYLEPFQSAVDEIPGQLTELLEAVADDPGQQRDARELVRLASKKLDELRLTIDQRFKHETAAAVAMVRSESDKQLMDRIRTLLVGLREQEERLLEARTVAARRRLDRAIWIDAAGGTGLLLLGVLLFRINRDIARREHLEVELREEVAFREQFIAILGHDLRNPLNAIAMSGQRLAAPGGVNEKFQRYPRIICSSADRMRRMVDQLLDMTRARRARGIPIEPDAETDLADLARRAADEIATANAEVDIAIDAPEQVVGTWDPDRLMQAVSNLVGNAVVHGRGRVTVRVGKQQGSAILEVHNAGPAVPEDVRERLFEPFYGATHPGTERRGLGLGLFITDRIVEAHGGRIEVQSTDADGTTFTVLLPTTPVNTRPSSSTKHGATRTRHGGPSVGREPI
jgi:signal transduction histidine kinase